MIASQDVQTTFFPTVIVRSPLSPYPVRVGRIRNVLRQFRRRPRRREVRDQKLLFPIHSGISSLSFFQNSNSLPFRARSKSREDKDESHRADKDAANP